MRTSWVSVAVAGILLTGCVSDTSSRTPASESVATTSTSAATTTTTSTTTTAPAPKQVAIVPTVVCIENRLSQRIFFAYTSDAPTSISIPVGPRNVVADADTTVAPLVPSVFAPGRVVPAFWAYRREDANGKLPTWTLQGPDGTSRTATPTASTPACTADLLLTTQADPRNPNLDVTVTVMPGNKRAELTGTVTGVPPTSVCPVGTDAQPVSLTTDDSYDGPATSGSTVQQSLELFTFRDASGRVRTSTSATVSVLVIDACSIGAEVSRSWPKTQAFERLRLGILYCIEVQDGKPTVLELDQPATCPGGLPATGGIRAR